MDLDGRYRPFLFDPVMPRFELNPPDVRADLLAALNRSFPGWGGEAAYRWYFGRRVGGPVPDLLALRGPSGLVAALGLNYRTVDLGAGEAPAISGIITSAWTSPEERGQGHFGRLAEESLRRIRIQGGFVALGFVTEENASCRVMERAGSTLVPSWYLFSTAATPRPRSAAGWEEVEPTPAVVEELRQMAARRRLGRLHFRYDRAEGWTSQFLRRPDPVEVLRISGDAWAIVERTACTDRVQLLLPGSEPEAVVATLLARAWQRHRRLFLFATSAALADIARGLGLVVKPGRITVRWLDDAPSGRRKVLEGRGLLDGGDRM